METQRSTKPLPKYNWQEVQLERLNYKFSDLTKCDIGNPYIPAYEIISYRLDWHQKTQVIKLRANGHNVIHLAHMYRVSIQTIYDAIAES